MECWLSQSVLQGKSGRGGGGRGRRKEASAYRLSFVFAAFGGTQAQWPRSIVHEERFKICPGRI